MRKFMYVTLVLVVMADIFLGVGLVQPFVEVTFESQVQAVLPAGFITLTNNQVFPLAPDGVFEGDRVVATCNRGVWLPVLFDCIINVYHVKPIKWEV